MLNAHDDHILLFAPASAFTAHAYLHDKVPYKPSDLIPIARITNTIIGVAVPTSLNFKTMKEFAAKVRAEPGRLNYASVTGANDLLFAAFLKTEKLKMAKVPYKGSGAGRQRSRGRPDPGLCGGLCDPAAASAGGKVTVLRDQSTAWRRACRKSPPPKKPVQIMTIDGLTG